MYILELSLIQKRMPFFFSTVHSLSAASSELVPRIPPGWTGGEAEGQSSFSWQSAQPTTVPLGMDIKPSPSIFRNRSVAVRERTVPSPFCP